MELNGVMSHFADDGIYEELNGSESKGHEAVRAALTPQFDGVFGDMKFIDEDLMIDAETGKVMASWRCTLDVKGEATSWRGPKSSASPGSPSKRPLPIRMASRSDMRPATCVSPGGARRPIDSCCAV